MKESYECELTVVTSELWKSDGGAVFGVVPKVMWSKFVEVDENNLIQTINRNLLIKDGDRIMLIDTGMGDKQDAKFFHHKHITQRNNIEDELKKSGYNSDDITDVILTHLHYDHVGGAVKRVNGELIPVFKNAKHWITSSQWNLAMNPNPREAASFFKENYVPLLDHNLVCFIDDECDITPNVSFRIFNGHTQGLIVPIIKHGGNTIVFMSDFIPSTDNIPIPYIPSYDTQPLITMQEKERFLNEAVENNYTLFFQHDAVTESCTLERTPKGIRAKKS